MKFYHIIITALFLVIGVNANAQKTVAQDTLIVKGVCGDCKNRIETAAYSKGVKFAEWTQETDKLVIAYRTDKTSIEEIKQRILDAGHSVGDTKPTKENYHALPKCCQYEEVEKH